MIFITIPGEPVAQGRPRFSTHAGRVHAYDPAKSRTYKDYVRQTAQITYRHKPLEGPLEMTVNIYRGIPKSWSKKKIEQAESGKIKPTLKPDVDNYVKAIKDALNGLIYRDDSQIIVLFIAKHYSRHPRVEIEIKEDRYAEKKG